MQLPRFRTTGLLLSQMAGATDEVFPKPDPPPTYVYERSFAFMTEQGRYWSNWITSDQFFFPEDCRTEAFEKYLEAGYKEEVVRVRILELQRRYVDQFSNEEVGSSVDC